MTPVKIFSMIALTILPISHPAAREGGGPNVQKGDVVYSSGYFGEPVDGLGAQHKAKFERGSQLFSRNWREAAAYARNAVSCVACHSVPMPGGSGMSTEALVQTQMEGAHTNVIQRYGHQANRLPNRPVLLRRTPPLFGIGLLDNAANDQKKLQKRKAVFGIYLERNDLTDMVASALANELGVSSKKYCARPVTQAKPPQTCLPLISDEELSDLVFFIRALAAPPRKAKSFGRAGETIFRKITCAACHDTTPRYTTRAYLDVAPLRVVAYTDLRRHDIGQGVNVRTAPLWGISSVGPPYLHDASAASIDDAIMRHEGEAAQSKTAYIALSKNEKAQLLEFLKGL